MNELDDLKNVMKSKNFYSYNFSIDEYQLFIKAFGLNYFTLPSFFFNIESVV